MTSSLRRLALLLATTVALVGCKKPAPERRSSGNSLHPAPEVSWKEGHLSQVLHIETDTTVEFYCCNDEGEMTVNFSGVSAFLYRVRVAKKDFQPEKQRAPGNFKMPVDDYIGTIPLASLKEAEQKLLSPIDVLVPITVQTFIDEPRSEVASTMLSYSFNPANAIVGTLKRAASSPVTMAGEQAGPPDAAIAIWDGPYFSVHQRETAKTLGDVDWVALPRWKDTGKTRSCGFDRGSVEFTLETVNLEVYDRRTAKKVAEKSFATAPGCPDMVFKAPGEKMSLGPDRAAMKAWLDVAVKRGSFVVEGTPR